MLRTRKGIVAVIQEKKGKVLLLERSDHPGSWQFPQGGIEEKETPEVALLRELKEEIGTNDIEVVRRSKKNTIYYWPKPVGDTLGSEQAWFLGRFKDGVSPKLEASEGCFSRYQWVTPAVALALIVDWKQAAFSEGLQSLGFPPGNLTVSFFEPEYREVFRDLNLAWIKQYFQVEKKDLEQLNAPEVCIKDGGQIFFVSNGDEVVGTCALYKTAATQFELAKMAVVPSQQSKGLGDLLMIAAERWARTQGATELLILSNTSLAPAITLYKKHGFITTRLGPNPEYARADIELRKSL